jgi:hypothetical protein
MCQISGTLVQGVTPPLVKYCTLTKGLEGDQSACQRKLYTAPLIAGNWLAVPAHIPVAPCPVPNRSTLGDQGGPRQDFRTPKHERRTEKEHLLYRTNAGRPVATRSLLGILLAQCGVERSCERLRVASDRWEAGVSRESTTHSAITSARATLPKPRLTIPN